MEIVNKYIAFNSIKVADALIAATAVVNDLKLYTDNKKHFDFIEGLVFYKEK